MKNKILAGIAVTLLSGLFLVCIFIGSRNLLRRRDMKKLNAATAVTYQKGEWVTFRVRLAEMDPYHIEHLLNGVLPIGNEYYYRVYSDDLGSMMIIRAGKDWYDRNFTDYQSNNPDGVLVTGYVRSLESEVSQSMESYRNSLRQKAGLPVLLQSKLYVDCLAIKVSVMELIIGIFPILCGILVLISAKTELFSHPADSRTGKIVLAVFFILLIAYCGMVIHFTSLV